MSIENCNSHCANKYRHKVCFCIIFLILILGNLIMRNTKFEKESFAKTYIEKPLAQC